MRTTDDWKKVRSRGQHLTDDEVAGVRLAYRQGRKISDVARELQCASRTICKYYGFCKAEGMIKSEVRRKQDDLGAVKSSRFYHSTFEL